MIMYLSYFKIRIIANLQYRAAAIAGILTQLFFGFVYLVVYVTFYKSNPGVTPPMEWSKLVSYLWLQQAFFALTYSAEKDQELLNSIRNGNIAYEMIRPQNFFLKYYVKMVAKKTSMFLLRCWPIIIIGFLLPEPYTLLLPSSFLNFILFLIAIVFSTLLISALVIIIHLLIVFTIDSKGLMSVYMVIIDLFMGNIVPLPFFPPILKKIAYILPFRYICDFPFRIYSGDILVNEGYSLLIQSALWTIAFIGLGLWLSKMVMRKAVIQGG